MKKEIEIWTMVVSWYVPCSDDYVETKGYFSSEALARAAVDAHNRSASARAKVAWDAGDRDADFGHAEVRGPFVVDQAPPEEA